MTAAAASAPGGAVWHPPRAVIVGFTPNLIDRLLESAGLSEHDRVLVVINLRSPDLVAQVEGAGLTHVFLEDFVPEAGDRLLLGVLRPPTKKKVIDDYLRRHPGGEASFRPAIHPFTSISPTAVVGTGCLFEPGVVVAPHASLGAFVSVNRNASIGHHTSIGTWCMINPGVNIASGCTVGPGVTIGMGTNVFDGVSIGEGSVIGGGSVVTRDVPAHVLAYGNPCRVIRDL